MAFGQEVDVKIDLIGTQGGQTTFNRLQYFSDTIIPVPDAEGFAVWADLVLWAAIKPLLSTEFRMQEVRADITQIGAPNAPTFVRIIDKPGDIIGPEVMPPNVTLTMRKVPDNSTVLPVGQKDFGFGRIGFTGLHENGQANGIADPATITAWNAAFTGLEVINIDAGNGPQDFFAGMARSANVLVGGNPVTKVQVTRFEANQLLGTQNSRKR